jgi:hypothetical protein
MIPQKLRKQLENDQYYKKCCLTGFTRFKIDWHHCFNYQGKQINEKWNIIPIYWRKHSPQGDPDSVHNCKETKDRAELIALKRATKEELYNYKKANLEQRLNYLIKKYER